jgi:hypothetical protein
MYEQLERTSASSTCSLAFCQLSCQVFPHLVNSKTFKGNHLVISMVMSPKRVPFYAASDQGSGNGRHLLADSSKKGKGKGNGKGKGKKDGKGKGKKDGKRKEKGDGEGKPGNDQGAQGTDQGGLGLGFGGINQAQQGEVNRAPARALHFLEPQSPM